MTSLTELRAQLREYTHYDERECIAEILQAPGLEPRMRTQVLDTARKLVTESRREKENQGSLDAFLQEFGLSDSEGVALMCLAESLLRIPDAATADRLIAEKILDGDWSAHRGHSDSLFVNASTWGLMLTGKFINLGRDITSETESWYRSLLDKAGEPVIRTAMYQAMKIMGGQYVLGRNIEEAITRGRSENSPGTRFSFDMLGEGARTASQAKTYFEAFLNAVNTLGAKANSAATQADGISVKLSALHPRYQFAQREKVLAEMLPRITTLAQACRSHGIGMSIDAEESERLDLSLDLFEALARDPALAGWDGLGFVLQTYQKRALAVAQWLQKLAQDCDRKINVRVVKGAYWDREIKYSQEHGHADYPVFTRKVNTDLCFEVCARSLLEANDVIYCQFATHNAYTVALVQALAPAGVAYEFQRLHGMGQLLYEQIDKQIPLRVYAPVGAHRDLLPYLVRRLLENGANSSFVNRFMDESVPVDELIKDPREQILAHSAGRHSNIPLPVDLFRDEGERSRSNSAGIDLDSPTTWYPLAQELQGWNEQPCPTTAIINGTPSDPTVLTPVLNPARPDEIVGKCGTCSPDQIMTALDAANSGQPAWDRFGPAARADILDATADAYWQHRVELISLLNREAGRTLHDAVDELREAIDFCRYYANRARASAQPQLLPGPTGETNQLSLHGRGVFACISPWNFPLAIFTGQVAAALVAGNSVIAKPAEQTPLIAGRAVQLILQSGVPADVLQLLTGDGPEIGKTLLADQRIAGVAFTGSTAAARSINIQLAQRGGAIVPLIAETGGQNAFIVDSTALHEQVVDDIIRSAFHSAGQRCSAARILFLQDDIAEPLLQMLYGACDELVLGDPGQLETDIGPVIDEPAREGLRAHIDKWAAAGRVLYSYPAQRVPAQGWFFGPQVVSIEDIEDLPGEVFGPVLHVIRYHGEELAQVIKQINASGYGLTLGIHTRIDDRAEDLFRRARVGNTYVNRNMVGAVVGVNPFGGQGLSGTGPKAGGPNYLLRFSCEKTFTINTVATGGNTGLFQLEE